MTFDQTMAVRCAELIAEAYTSRGSATVNNAHTDTQVHIRDVDGIRFAIFPGTASFRDGLTDLRFVKADWDAGRVHIGFRQAIQSIYGETIRALGMEKTELPMPLVITGHSLGGALATLFAHRLQTVPRGLAVYTLGSPRVGNGEFARAYDALLHDQTFRIVNARDPVTKVPWVLRTYRHVGREVFLGDDGTLEVDRPWWRHVTEEFLPVIEADEARNFVCLGAHGISSYVRKLKTCSEV